MDLPYLVKLKLLNMACKAISSTCIRFIILNITSLYQMKAFMNLPRKGIVFKRLLTKNDTGELDEIIFN